MQNANKVQYLDVIFEIPRSTHDPLQKWLQVFLKEFPYVNITPRLDDKKLEINSQDLVEFTGYWNPEEISPFELQKILANARDQIEILAQKAVSNDNRYHYRWCLTALKNLHIGRKINVEPTS